MYHSQSHTCSYNSQIEITKGPHSAYCGTIQLYLTAVSDAINYDTCNYGGRDVRVQTFIAAAFSLENQTFFVPPSLPPVPLRRPFRFQSSCIQKSITHTAFALWSYVHTEGPFAVQYSICGEILSMLNVLQVINGRGLEGDLRVGRKKWAKTVLSILNPVSL